jgi:hypothetical protein
MIPRPRASAALIAALIAVSGNGSAWGGPSGPVHLAPHRAVYDISLERTSPGSGVADMTGRLVYEITGSTCEGFTQSMRFVTRTTNQEGETSITDLRTSSWEDVPSRRLRFSTNTFQNEQLAEQTKGDARRSQSHEAARVDLDKPARKSVDVAAGVFFPVQHSVALIEAARSGKRMFKADLYDGSDNGEKIYATSAAIGRMAEPGAIAMPALAENGDKLARVPSWPISISYYEPAVAKSDTLPAYEMSYRFHDNGVTSKLMIDHGEFAFKGELKELVFLDATECAGEGKP